MQKRAQGAIEYLLIIGAAILVVAIVILAITGVLSSGQGQTAASEQSALDAMRALKVTGMGYTIDINMADYSYETFPVPQTTDCKDPTNNQRIGCFYTPTTVNLLVDGAVVAQYDMTGISDYKIFTYTFKGDPQMEHKLQLTYEDCWAGYLKQDSVIPDNAAINDNLYVLNGGGKKCSDPSVATGTICTMCNDYALWDKNLKFGSIKITNSDGKETVIQPDTYWSNYFPEIKFK